MVTFLRHRIGDRRILRLIKRWLRAGVLEDGEWSETEKGTLQGSAISPLLANVYLHYRLRPLGSALAEASGCGGSHRGPLCGRQCATTAQKGVLHGHLKQPCCMRDEGGPLEAGLKGRASNHLKLLWSKAMVG